MRICRERLGALEEKEEHGTRGGILPSGLQKRGKTLDIETEAKQPARGPGGSDCNFLYLLASVNLKILIYGEAILDS